MKDYELSPEARNELQDIWIFIAADNIASGSLRIVETAAERRCNCSKKPHR
jgi:hypothetical protein